MVNIFGIVSLYCLGNVGMPRFHIKWFKINSKIQKNEFRNHIFLLLILCSAVQEILILETVCNSKESTSNDNII